MENALFKYCFPLKCRAVEYCNKWNDIPKYFDKEISSLENTHHCEYKNAYYNYLESDKWSNIRNIVLMRGKLKCEKCGKKEHLDVHHLNYKSVFDEVLKDLLLLCRDCHQDQHTQ